MKRELGISRCGLACCLCSMNDKCDGCDWEGCSGSKWCENRKCSMEKNIAGCYDCSEECSKGLLSKTKSAAFISFAKTYGIEKLLDCLEENEKRGVVYHREGIVGDYDDFDNIDDVIAFIKTGTK